MLFPLRTRLKKGTSSLRSEVNKTDTPVPEPSPGPEVLYSPSELDHYFLDPDGLNLIDPFAIPQRLSNNDDIHEGDPEPSPGPYDPG